MAERILIAGAKIVNEGRIFEGDVLIENGRIKKITSPPSHYPIGEGDRERGRIDGRRKYLLPGVIDDHVHFREPGFTDKGDIHSESKAAVAGGITSFMDMPNTNPKATTLDFLEEKFTIARQKSYANYSFFLGATNDNILEIEKADPSRICGLKVFMGSSTGSMLVDDTDILEKIFERSPLMIAVHAEEESIIQENLRIFTEKYNGNIPVEAHSLIRSEEACYQSSVKAIKLAGKHGARLHLLHLSTAKELDLLDNSIPLERKKITGEACVNHLWFDDRDYKKSSSRIKWNPSVKKESDKKELLRGVLDNRIDIIASDHAPHTIEEKQKPYLSCPSGAPMVQHSLIAMLELFHRNGISMEKIVDKMCHGPAILYRIKNRGFIREGYFADLVMVDPKSSWKVNSSNILYKCGWSPLEGQLFSSRVTHTIVNGCIVYENGNFDETMRGMRLEFNPDLYLNK